MKRLIVTAGFLLAATSASLARDHGYFGTPYGYGPYDDSSGVTVYDNAPGGAYISGDPYSGAPVRQKADGW
jgi:hypothetical protein